MSRCFALAQEAKTRGHSCAFVLSDTKYRARINPWFPVFIEWQQTSWPVRIPAVLSGILRPKAKKSIPLYLGISGLDYQVIRDGLVSEQSIRNILERYRSVVKTFKPDVLVGDTNFLVWMLSQDIGVPVVQIVRYASHPLTAKLIWWENIPKDVVPPNLLTLFNPILENAGLQHIEKIEDLFRGNFYIVPSIPDIEPICSDRTEHVGGLLVSGNGQTEGSWSEWLNGSMEVIYVTIGGGAGPVGNKLFFSSIIEAFADYPAKIIVSTGGKFNAANCGAIPSNIRFFDWVPGRQVMSKANLVIFHGGHATMMETIAAGKPSIIIPFHTEQEGNGRRLEQLGCGCVLKLSNEPFEQVNAKCPFGEYSYIVQRRYDLTSSELISTVNKTLQDSGYSTKAQALQKKVIAHGGPSRAIDIIERFPGAGQ